MQYFRKYSPYSECAQLFNQWLWKLFCTVIGKYNIMIQNMLASNAKSSNLIFFQIYSPLPPNVFGTFTYIEDHFWCQAYYMTFFLCRGSVIQLLPQDGR